jgi:hypothetical protein
MKSKLAGSGLGFEAGQVAGRLTGIPGMGYIGGMAGAKAFGPTIDAIIKPLIRGGLGISGEGFSAASDFIKNVSKGNDLLTNGAKALFEAGNAAHLDLKPDQQKLDQLKEHIEALKQHPEAMMNVGGSLGHYLPAQQTALAATAQNAVNYLSAQTPRDVQPGVLNAPVTPSKAQEASYNRTLSIAEQPLVVLHHIKNGTLQPKDVQDLHTLYPALVPRIINKVNEHMINHISKENPIPFKVRRGLSMLMGQPLDATMTQPATLAAQMTFMPSQPSQQPQGAPKAKKSTAKVGKSAEMAETAQESRNKALSKA